MVAISAYGAYKQNETIKAANEATKQGISDTVDAQNKVTEDAFKKSQEGTMLAPGANTAAGEQSKNGTILTTQNDKRSLLGG